MYSADELYSIDFHHQSTTDTLKRFAKGSQTE